MCDTAHTGALVKWLSNPHPQLSTLDPAVKNWFLGIRCPRKLHQSLAERPNGHHLKAQARKIRRNYRNQKTLAARVKARVSTETTRVQEAAELRDCVIVLGSVLSFAAAVSIAQDVPVVSRVCMLPAQCNPLGFVPHAALAEWKVFKQCILFN